MARRRHRDAVGHAKIFFTAAAESMGADRNRKKNFPVGLRAGHSQRGNLVGAIGLEPTTPTMSSWCSNQLSYAPEVVFERPKFSRLLKALFSAVAPIAHRAPRRPPPAPA